MLNASLNQPVTPAMSRVVALAPVLDWATATESFAFAAGFASAGLAAAGAVVAAGAAAAGLSASSGLAASASFAASAGLAAAGAAVGADSVFAGGAGGWPAQAVTMKIATAIRSTLLAHRCVARDIASSSVCERTAR